MAVPASMTVLDISARYTMVRGLTLATSGHYYLRSRYLWPILVADIRVEAKSRIVRWAPSLTLMTRVMQNKSMSGDTDEVLALQGVSWWKRKIIGAATITLDVNHYKDEEGIENIDIKQTLTGGLSGEFRHHLP
jgi:hypothetical protein